MSNTSLVDGNLAADVLATEDVEKRGSRFKKKHRGFGTMGPTEKVIRYVLLILMVFVTIGPFLWQFSTSLKSPNEDIYAATLSFIPQEPTLENYAAVGRAIPVWHYIFNSIKVAILAVGGNVVFATAAGFALAKLKFRGKSIVGGLFLGVLILPGEATIVSQFVTIRNLGLADTLMGVALPGMVGALNVLLMWNAFRVVPKEIDEAAVMDGATVWDRLVRIGVPSVRGTIAVIAIFSFIGAWDDFLWPLIVLTSPDQFTLTIGLQYLAGTFANDQRLIAAGTMIAFIPVALLFGALQRFFFKGVEEGGVKG